MDCHAIFTLPPLQKHHLFAFPFFFFFDRLLKRAVCFFCPSFFQPPSHKKSFFPSLTPIESQTSVCIRISQRASEMQTAFWVLFLSFWFTKSGPGSRFCISNRFLDNADSSDQWTTLWKTPSYRTLSYCGSQAFVTEKSSGPVSINPHGT